VIGGAVGTLAACGAGRKARSAVWIGALVAVVGWGSSAAAQSWGAATRVLDAPRYYASPVGEVRWLDVGDGLLLVSDLRLGVAGLRVESGETAWNAGAFLGTLDRVERVGERVVLVGASVDVLERLSGRRLWRRELGCGGRGGCQERVVYVGGEGVLVLAQDDGGARLGLVGLDDGKPRWRSALRVAAASEVRVVGGALVIEGGAGDGEARVVELVSGREVGADTRIVERAPVAVAAQRSPPRGAPPAGRWLAAGRQDVYLVAGAPPVALVVDRRDGGVVAAGEAAAGPDAAVAAAVAGDVLFLAAGRGVSAHAFVSVADFAGRVAESLEDGGADDAGGVLEPLRRTGVAWAGLEGLEARVARARGLARTEAIARGEAGAALDALAAGVRGAAVGAEPGLAGLSREATALVAGHLVDPGRAWGAAEVAALEGLADALTSRFSELPRPGAHADRQSAAAQVAVRGAAVALAAALVSAQRGEAAASLLRAYTDQGLGSEPGLEALAQHAAASALGGALRELRPMLRGRDRAAIADATRLLAAVKHADLALAEDPDLVARLEAIRLADDPARLPGLDRVSGAIDKALKRLAQALGPGLGEPGCVAVCRAARDACSSSCGSLSEYCSAAFLTCATECHQTGRVRFATPSQGRSCAD
jgi:hypothetical protein